MWATIKGHTEIVQDLLAAGADVDRQDRDGKNALHAACDHGKTEIVKHLLAANAKVDIQREGGWTALMNASVNGHGEIVRALLAANAKINLQEDFHYDTALHLACFRGKVQIARDLILAGASITIKRRSEGRTENGETIFHEEMPLEMFNATVPDTADFVSTADQQMLVDLAASPAAVQARAAQAP